MSEEKIGDLRVWHIPQVPGLVFHVPVASLDEAKKVLEVLQNYDLFQYKNRIKGDYANASGLEVAETDENGELEWCEWNDEDGYDITEVMRGFGFPDK